MSRRAAAATTAQRGGGRPQHAHGPDSGRHRADGRGDEHLAEAVAGEAQRHRAPAQVRRVSARRYLDHLASTGEAEVRAKLAGRAGPNGGSGGLTGGSRTRLPSP